jgi:hypothetical protein
MSTAVAESNAEVLISSDKEDRYRLSMLIKKVVCNEEISRQHSMS